MPVRARFLLSEKEKEEDGEEGSWEFEEEERRSKGGS